MGSNYYYLYSSLPEIDFNERTDYRSFSHLFDDVWESLSDEDQIAMRYIRYPIDNANLIHLLEDPDDEDRQFIKGGNYTYAELIHEIQTRDTAPRFMTDFLESHQQMSGQPVWTNIIDLLNIAFYDQIINPTDTEFVEIDTFNTTLIKRWYEFERDFRNVLTAQECLKHNEPIERRETVRLAQKMGQRLLGDNDITQSLLYSKAYDYSLSGLLPWMSRVLKLNSENITRYEKELLQIKLDMLDEFCEDEIFTIDTILAYFIKLGLLIRWSSLDETRGRQHIENLSKKIIGKNILSEKVMDNAGNIFTLQ